MKARKILSNVRKGAKLSFFWAQVRILEERVGEGDQAGFYEELKIISK